MALRRRAKPLEIRVAYIIDEHPLPLVYSVRKDWPELIQILNKGLVSITEQERTHILKKYLMISPDEKPRVLNLTTEEKAWLEQKHTVRVRVVNIPPYIILKKGAEPEGISIDYLNLIAEHTGVKFKYDFSGKIFPEALDGLKRHQGPDLITSTVRTPEREKSVLYTKEYVRSPYVIFTNEDDKAFISDMTDLRGKKIALPKGTVIHEKVKSGYPDFNLVLFDNDAQAITAVATKKADAYIGNLTLASFIILEEGLSNIKIAGPSPFGDHIFAMGIRNDWPELGSIMDKALASISPEEQAEIRNKYISIRYEHTETAVIIKWIFIIGGAASGIVLLFFFWNRSLTKQVQERTSELETTNISLETEIDERKQAAKKILEYQQRLKALASQLTVTEETERHRIAADLHDHVGQSLALVRMQIAAARKSVSDDGLTAKLDDVSETLLRTVQDVRHLMFDLTIACNLEQ